MKNLLLCIFVFTFISCQESLELNEPRSFSNSENNLQKFPKTNDLTVQPEYDVNVYLLAEGLYKPEGAVFYPPSKGLLINESLDSKIVDIHRHGVVSDYTTIPATNPCLVDLLYDPNRGVFVTSLFEGKIFNINKKGVAEEYVSGLWFPLFMELDNKRNLYVSELFNNSITKIDQSKNISMVVDFAQYHFKWNPRGIVFDSKDNLFVLSGRTNEIMCFDINNTTNFPIIASPAHVIAQLSEAYFPQDITMGFGKDLFVVDFHNIWILKMEGNQVVDISLFISGIVGPYTTIHSNSSGDLIVTDLDAGKVYGISKTVFKIN